MPDSTSTDPASADPASADPASLDTHAVRGRLSELARQTDPVPPPDPYSSPLADTREVLRFGVILVATIVDIAGDGVGPLDVIGVLRADDLREAFGPAVDDVTDIAREVQDATVGDWFDLSKWLVGLVQTTFLSDTSY